MPQVYIWEDTSKPFSIALGNGLIMDLKWEVEFNINCPCFLSWGNLLCGCEHDLYSFYNIVINRLYQIGAITEENNKATYLVAFHLPLYHHNIHRIYVVY